MWEQPEGLRSGVLWAGEWNTMAEGTWEKVWTCRRDKAPFLGRVRVGEADLHRKLLVPEDACVAAGPQRGVSSGTGCGL